MPGFRGEARERIKRRAYDRCRPKTSGYNKYRQAVYERDGHKCVYCNSIADLTLDHLMPQKHGGTHEISNLVTACRSCNSKKNSKTPEEWLNEE